MDVLEQDA